MEIAKKRPAYSLPCSCEHVYDTGGRFPVWRIVTFNRACAEHGWMFEVNVAAILRHGD